MEKSLIIYFSHNQENYVAGNIKVLAVGSTAIMAKKIQKIIAGDLFEIQPLHEYPANYHACTSLAKKEYQQNARPKVANIVSHMEEYQNIYLGYPNWWGTMPMCVWTFLESYDLTGKHIYPFCSHEGSGLGDSIQDLQTLCPNSYIHQGLAIYGSQVENSEAKIKQWLQEKRK